MSFQAISISTLSPIHIGCDEVFEPSNFVIHDGLLHALEVADLVTELNEAERKQLSRLTEEREPIGAIQRFFKSKAQRFAKTSRHQVTVAGAIANEYEEKIGRPVQQNNTGYATYNLFPIARTAFRPLDNTPYLPGSSLKGSIRTAWLNHLLRQRGNPLRPEDSRDKNKARTLQERLLGYTAGKFEQDPFRHIALSDAHPEAEKIAPPTRVLYAISKKKRISERGTPELKVYLETVPDALPAAFQGELRLTGNINWAALCDACNQFYRPQLESELNHDILGNLIDSDWKKLISGLLGDELTELAKARQGFLLRVGKHSGAESVTLDGIRLIKILGKKGEQPSYRSNTTEKRFASLTKAGSRELLPFGWIWVDACDDQHRHIFDRLQQKLAKRSEVLRSAHEDRLLNLEIGQQQRQAKIQADQASALAAIEAKENLAKKLASMTPSQREIDTFCTECQQRAEQINNGRKDNPNTAYHAKANQLAKKAHESTDWSAEEKAAAADAIEIWLPRIVVVDIKEARKKLKLAALRGQ
jgi:CRISPR-associated protein Csm5